ncbi:hypothetical protein CFR73_05215 [Novacetimonas maltaceti]|uniref:Uncharacterized protein n=1 Tax=Novacetimonas maltaceti TaxID=1203393 RepID=A0A2S3W197_9PROT|nr:hypothetical protein [Novacetimonas maltaceti]POF62655.1 hypothetical protein KMAL_16820 [Novacetimonas maltaceti]PYD61070.1 hypothetical protein CFR73_05215 [Novacetimonas maltaceti]
MPDADSHADHPLSASPQSVAADIAHDQAASTDVPDPGPVPGAQPLAPETRDAAGDAADAAAVATGGSAAVATAVPPELMPFKELLQLMGAIIFVMVLLAIGWAGAHASGVWPE